MKHLKKFNESYTEWDLNLIRKFCYENLAYLLDGSAEVKFTNSCIINFGDKKVYPILIENIDSKWVDIEDDIIPFFELLQDKYQLYNNEVQIQYYDSYHNNIIDMLQYTISEVISGISITDDIHGIKFYIILC